MTVSPVLRLPPEQLEMAARHYRDAIAAKRARIAIGAAILACAVVLAGIAGEVDAHKFFANIHRLPAYIWNLTPTLSWKTLGADLAEWFWNLDGWLRLLVDTLLIAYLGTLLGGVGAFALCFFLLAPISKSGAGCEF
jgi:phosphonate transport system permease protein